MPAAMEDDEAANPIDVRTLCLHAVAPLSQSAAHDLHQPEGLRRIGRGIQMRLRDETVHAPISSRVATAPSPFLGDAHRTISSPPPATPPPARRGTSRPAVA